MMWHEENVLELIEAYKCKEELWDPKHKDHYRKNIKEDAWVDIANSVGFPVEVCKTKMVNLQASYRREKIRMKQSRRTAKGVAEIYKSRWFAFKAFSFLEHRGQSSNLLNTDTSENLNDIAQEKPRPPKRLKIKEEGAECMEQNVKDLKTQKNEKEPKDRRNTSLADFLVAKMDMYPPQIRDIVEHSILQILMDADRGLHNIPTQYLQNIPVQTELGHSPTSDTGLSSVYSDDVLYPKD